MTLSEVRVRPFDAERLDRRMAALLTGQSDGQVRRSALSGGLSQMTLRYQAGERSAVVRVPPEFGPLEPYEPVVEATLMTMMSQFGVPAPEVLAIEADAGAVGRPYFATAFVQGTMAAEASGLSVDAARERATAFIELLASVHAAPIDQSSTAGSLRDLLDHLPRKTASGVLDRWDTALTASGVEVPEYQRFLAAWLRARQPVTSQRLTVVHGDFRLANVLWHNDYSHGDSSGVVALLDWEEAALGDPVYDLAWLLMGSFADDDVVYGIATRRELLSAYARFGGFEVDTAELLWWEVAVGWALLAMNAVATRYVADGRYHDLRPMLYGYMNRRIARTLLRKVSAAERLYPGERA